MNFTVHPSPIQQVQDDLLLQKRISLYIKRDDLLHPQLSGNKWRKLKYNLEEAKLLDKSTLLTFGGAYSNHIYAVAAAGKLFGFNTIGIIRGEKIIPLNRTLQFAADHGMQLQFISREKFRKKESSAFLNELKNLFGNFYLLPEGGTNTLAVKGCEEIISEINIDFDYLCCPCGTGGTLAGIISGLKGKKKVIGFSVLKGMNDLENKVEQLVFEFRGEKFSNWHINHNYHSGGYAKSSTELFSFIQQFKMDHNILLDSVYTGKMMFGIFDLMKKNYFKERSTIIAIHTGGLQGMNEPFS